MEFLEWFETCPFWQALGMGATIFSLIMGATGLLLRVSARNRKSRYVREFIAMRETVAGV